MYKNMHSHIVKSYDEELRHLGKCISEMGELVSEMFELAELAVSDPAHDVLEKALETDLKINALDTETEKQAVTMLALRQPMASDLRFIISSIKISVHLERLGDLAKNIIRRSVEFEAKPTDKQLKRILKMIKLLKEMLTSAISAIENLDETLALSVWKQDEKVNKAYLKFFEKIIPKMAAKPDEGDVENLTNLLFTAKNLERIGDHITSIGKVVYYIVSGKKVTKEERDTLIIK